VVADGETDLMLNSLLWDRALSGLITYYMVSTSDQMMLCKSPMLIYKYSNYFHKDTAALRISVFPAVV